MSQMKSLSHVWLFVTPLDCSLLGSSVHGIFQARILVWAAISFPRGSLQPRDRTQVSRIIGRCFYHLSHQGMQNAQLDEAQAGIKITGRTINNLRYVDDTTFTAESEELKSVMMKVKEESEKVGSNSTFRKLRSWNLVPSLHEK